MALEQKNRFLGVTTALGDNVLLLTGFTGQEELSRLFSFRLDFISDQGDISPNGIVGKAIAFRVALPDNKPRHFHGFVNRFQAGDEDDQGRREYRAEVVPWLWFLTQTADCRIFQKKSIPQIVEQVFKDLGFTDFEMRLQGQHLPWEYCVQYRETDFNFVSRLLEHEGIFYFFRHEKNKHVMVLTDNKTAYFDCPENEVSFPFDMGRVAHQRHLTAWQHQYEFRPGKWAQTDYNFETPATNLMTTEQSVVMLPGLDKFEIYDHPGEYEQKNDGSADTKVRLETEESAVNTVEAASNCCTFSPGGKFTVSEHRSASEAGKTFVIKSIRHSASEPFAYETGAGAAEDYSNSFACIPESVTFRPARATPKPLISGPQTAVVVGPKGEEILCDKYGRVKVQFHWDREGKRDEKSSCWMRVAQSVAGRQWGFVALPRIGQEVVVIFLEGDPDRPLIAGSVYNAEQMPHYALPDQKTKTYIKTNSTLGGEGFNELMFEDKKSEERIFVHAQKNMDVRVLNDSKERIFGNRHQIMGWEKDGKKGGDQRELVYEDKHLNVKRHQFEHIEGNLQLQVGGGEAEEGGNFDLAIEKKKTELVEGDSDLKIKGNHKEKIDGQMSLTVGGDQHVKVGGNIAHEAGSAGEIHVKAGMKIVIEAGMQISLVGPGGFIDIGPAGVTIQGTLVKINSGGAAAKGKGCKAQEPQEAKKAKPAKPELAHNSTSGHKSAPG